MSAETKHKKKGGKKKKKNQAVSIKKFVHPSFLRAALNELDTLLTVKGCRLVEYSHPSYDVVRAKAVSSLSDVDVGVYLRYRETIVRQTFGTVMPTFMVTLLDAAVTPTAGVLTLVYTVTYSNVNDSSVYTSMFDEYMFKSARMEWIPYRLPGFSAANQIATAVGVIDYVDNTSLASFASGFSFDTMKLFYLELPNGPYREEWHMHFLGPPDETWSLTGANVGVGYWKVYAWQGTAGSTTYGNVHGYAKMAFRQKHT